MVARYAFYKKRLNPDIADIPKGKTDTRAH